MELSRLLRRGLLVAAVAVAGWLLSVLFAASASAEEAPGGTGTTSTPQSQSGGLLGGLIGGVTGTLTGLTDTVTNVTGSVLDTVDTTSQVLTPDQQPAREPDLDLPELLPSFDSSAGTNTTDRVIAAPRVEPPAPAPPAPVVAPPPVVAPDPAPVVPAAPPAPQPTPVVRDSGADQHAGQSDPEPRPVKAPASPAGPGTTAAPAHDGFGSARHAHGVLPAQATLHPADAGFTTRSRAVDAAGRNAGLPASSPD